MLGVVYCINDFGKRNSNDAQDYHPHLMPSSAPSIIDTQGLVRISYEISSRFIQFLNTLSYKNHLWVRMSMVEEGEPTKVGQELTI